MTYYNNIIKELRPFLYDFIYNDSSFVEIELKRLIESINIDQVYIDYNPFTIYIEYNEVDISLEMITERIESMLRDIIDCNPEICDVFFDYLYSQVETNDDDRNDFFLFIKKGISNLYSLSVISIDNYNKIALVVL